MIASDGLAEIVAVTVAIEREGTRDIAIVVPDIGPYEHASASALEGRNIATRRPRPERLDESPAGRWLRTFLLAADDLFARPLLVDLLQQLAIAGILPVDDVIEADRVSRRDWVLDARHWQALTADDRIDAAVRHAMRVILQAGAALDTCNHPLPLALLDLIAHLDPGAPIRRALRWDGTEVPITNRTHLRRAFAELGPARETSGVAIHRLSEAFWLTQSTAFVVGWCRRSVAVRAFTKRHLHDRARLHLRQRPRTEHHLQSQRRRVRTCTSAVPFTRLRFAQSFVKTRRTPTKG